MASVKIVSSYRKVKLDLSKFQSASRRHGHIRKNAYVHSIAPDEVEMWIPARPRLVYARSRTPPPQLVSPPPPPALLEEPPPPEIKKRLLPNPAPLRSLTADYVSRATKKSPKLLLSVKSSRPQIKDNRSGLEERNRLTKKWNRYALLLLVIVVFLGLCAVGIVTTFCFLPLLSSSANSTTSTDSSSDSADSAASSASSSAATAAAAAASRRNALQQLVRGHFCFNGGKRLLTIEGEFIRCECDSKFFGSQCQFRQSDVDLCFGKPCQHGGLCSSDSKSFTCACTPGWHGNACHVAVDECDEVYCSNGGTCTDGLCACENGWSGYRCRIPTNTPTAKRPCKGYYDHCFRDCSPRPNEELLDCVAVIVLDKCHKDRVTDSDGCPGCTDSTGCTCDPKTPGCPP